MAKIVAENRKNQKQKKTVSAFGLEFFSPLESGFAQVPPARRKPNFNELGNSNSTSETVKTRNRPPLTNPLYSVASKVD